MVCRGGGRLGGGGVSRNKEPSIVGYFGRRAWGSFPLGFHCLINFFAYLLGDNFVFWNKKNASPAPGHRCSLFVYHFIAEGAATFIRQFKFSSLRR